MTNAEARFYNSLRPRKPEGLLGQTAQDGHLDSHTAPVAVRDSPSLIVRTVSVDVKQNGPPRFTVIVQELCESRWTSWAVRPNEPSGFRGRKELLNHASALVTTCP